MSWITDEFYDEGWKENGEKDRLWITKKRPFQQSPNQMDGQADKQGNHPADLFKNLMPRDQEIVELYFVHKRRTVDFEA